MERMSIRTQPGEMYDELEEDDISLPALLCILLIAAVLWLWVWATRNWRFLAGLLLTAGTFAGIWWALGSWFKLNH